MLKLTPLALNGLYLLETKPFVDERGSFFRIFCQEELEKHGLSFALSQANMSTNIIKGSIRGMHFQYPPHAEIKIIRCVQGACFDVVVDLRQGSPTFLQWSGHMLTPENRHALYIPKGFAHGFQTCEPNTQLLYMHSDFYTPSCEGAVRYNDPSFNIQWPLPIRDISERDTKHPLINTAFAGI